MWRTLFILFLLVDSVFAEARWTAKTNAEGEIAVFFNAQEEEGFSPDLKGLEELLSAQGEDASFRHVCFWDYLWNDPVIQRELMEVFEADHPSSLKAALGSSGNMHNPKVLPLRKVFPECLLKTPSVREIDALFRRHGHTISSVSHEKFWIDKTADPVRFFSTPWLILSKAERGDAVEKGYGIPIVDISEDKDRQVIVDKEPGQYLGHPTTVLLEDNKTMICVYPKGHGKGGIVMKRSCDAGKTWSERLPTPENWQTSKEVPTIHRLIGQEGKKRLIMWSGLYPARLAVSEDDGESWSELKQVGDWGGIVVMGFVEPITTGKGHFLAMFHDDGRFFKEGGKREETMTLYQTTSKDGGLTWSDPEAVWKGADVHLCEPGCIRSPDGKQLAVLLRENRRRRNSHVIFSNDEGKTWSEPRELPGSLTGDRHTGRYAPDGRLFISFRDTTLESPTKGDWVGWVGTYEDIVKGNEGQYRVHLMDNHESADCAYPGVEILPDGTFVTTTYGHWIKNEKPFIVSVRFKLDELDAKLKQ